MPSPSTVVDRASDMEPTEVGCVSRTLPSREDSVLSFAQWRARLIAAEASSGWLDECDDAGRFLAISREFVEALAVVLRRLAGDSPVLEVCAGSGALAFWLAALGVHVQATDAEPPRGSAVLRMSAQAALYQFQPAVVMGVFVPYDAGVDEAVLACPSTQHYVIVNARIGGALGSPSLWTAPGWRSEPLDNVRRWVLTRHDVWLGHAGKKDGDLLQHGEVWHFERSSERSFHQD